MALFDGTAFQEEIALIRALGFEPKDERVIQLVRERGLERALEILQLVAAFNRTMRPVHSLKSVH